MRARIFTVWLLLFILGAMLAPLFEAAPQLYLILGLALVVSSFFVFSRRYAFAVMFGIGVFLISISSFQARELNLIRQNEAISAEKVEIEGYVSGVTTTNEFGQTIPISITSVNGLPEQAKLKVYAPAYPTFDYAQKLRFTTKVKPYGDKKWRLVPSGYVGEANLSDYIVIGTQEGPLITLQGWLFGVRDKFNESLSRSLAAAESGLASGLILGEKALITPEVIRQLQISGTTHIIALSGYNITIIIGLFVIFDKKLTRLMRLLVPVVFILLFVLMTGGAASLIRAAIMGFMPLLAVYLGRESDSFIAILCSAAIMLLFNPFLALFDVGFQLSFAALAGMIYLAPLVLRPLGSLPEYISGPFSETVGAQIAAMPLLAYYFGSVSLISPISNLIILSMVPAGMLIAFVIGLSGLIWQPLATFLAIPGYIILHSINLLIAFFGSLPAASRSLKIESPVWILLAYFLMFDLWLIFKRPKVLETA
jgi:competence protein ComEC